MVNGTGIRYLPCGICDRAEGVKCLYTMRDIGRGCDFSMALHTGEDSECILSNRRELENCFPRGSRFVSVRQVHGSDIHIVSEKMEMGWRSLDDTVEADAIVTNLPGVVLTVLTADCVPVLLYDPVAGVVSAIHAGWRGSDSGIVRKCIEKICDIYGSVASDIVASIGPSIRGCCYEVGEDVASRFADYGSALSRSDRGGYMLDLSEVNRIQMMESGVLDENIFLDGVCTACGGDGFFSYRADDGCSGRFAGSISLLER